MKTLTLTLTLAFLLLFSSSLFSQTEFKITGKSPIILSVNRTFTTDAQIAPFSGKINSIYGLSIIGDVNFLSDYGEIKVILRDNNYNEYLVYESSSLTELENMNNEIKIFPNPTNEKLYLQFDNFDDQTTAYIYNVNGSLITFENISNNVTIIDTRKLESGVYFVVVRNKNINLSKKFVKN